MITIPRPEHPKPQFRRTTWLNLNGTWHFELDPGCSGHERGLPAPTAVLKDTIMVPFCPESTLSGVGNTDFMRGVWYQRHVMLTEEQLSGRTFLHFGAVDYTCQAYVNGQSVGIHHGGYTSFCFDITDAAVPGDNVITVAAYDDTRHFARGSGKQSPIYASYGCMYTRTTGIWQTVWLEFTPKTYLQGVTYQTDIDTGEVTVTARVIGTADLTAEAFYEGKPMATVTKTGATGTVVLTLTMAEIHLWEAGAGRLYDLTFRFGDDIVHSYVGLREVALSGEKFLLNRRSVFMRTVLDQGFYPDGIYTAPSDEELRRDIERAQAYGFNGARLHEKIFEERFLYHCDRAGYLVWGEYPNWGFDIYNAEGHAYLVNEWLEVLQRDINHPAIIGWCPFNETWGPGDREMYEKFIRLIYNLTKAMDPTRIVIDSSGGFHVPGYFDMYDVHDYGQSYEEIRDRYACLGSDKPLSERYNPERGCYRKGMPFFLSEMGGTFFGNGAGWGYGKAPDGTPDPRNWGENVICSLCRAVMENEHICGFCYTQLTDVEQEQNGFYTYDRKPKFNFDTIRDVLTRKAAIEE